MSKRNKINAPKAEHAANTMKNSQANSPSALPFGKSNYKFMLIGIATILLGFLIMTQDKEEFGFGFLGLTLGPIVVFVGFMIEIYAILKKKA